MTDDRLHLLQLLLQLQVRIVDALAEEARLLDEELVRHDTHSHRAGVRVDLEHDGLTCIGGGQRKDVRR